MAQWLDIGRIRLPKLSVVQSTPQEANRQIDFWVDSDYPPRFGNRLKAGGPRSRRCTLKMDRQITIICAVSNRPERRRRNKSFVLGRGAASKRDLTMTM